MADPQPTVPPEVALGDGQLRLAVEAGAAPEPLNNIGAGARAAIAQAHYQRQIALVLTDLLDLFSHQHGEHGEHGEQAKAEDRARLEAQIAQADHPHPHEEEPDGA